jgi:hypothetical protein
MSYLLDSILDDHRLAQCARQDYAETLDALFVTPPEPSTHERIGQWVAWHYRQRAMESGTQTAARQLRKQGYPLKVSLLILAGQRPYVASTRNVKPFEWEQI